MYLKTRLRALAVLVACALGFAAPLQADMITQSNALLQQSSMWTGAATGSVFDRIDALPGLPLVRVNQPYCTTASEGQCIDLQARCLNEGGPDASCAIVLITCLCNAGCMAADQCP